MPEHFGRTRWQRFCAAMVKHGHGRTCDISAASACRRRHPGSGGKAQPVRPAETVERRYKKQRALFT